MTSPFSYLSESIRITPADNGKLEVSVTVPADHVDLILQLLDTLTGFVQIISRKSRLQKRISKQDDKKRRQQIEQVHADYYALIVPLFDQYTADGLNRYEAIKRIGADLRAKNHPWSSPDIIRPALREAGRGGRVGRPRRQQ